MSLRVEPFEGSPAAWDALIDSAGCVYQRHAFGEVLRVGMGQRILRLWAIDDAGPRAAVSVAVLKSPLFGRMGVSLPVSDHSGLCSVDPEARDALLAQLGEVLQNEGLTSIEMRHIEGQAPLPTLPKSDHKLTLELDLPATSEELWSSLKAKVRNLVRKGERGGLEYSRGGLELLDVFYPIYARNLRDLGTPSYPRVFFAGLLERFSDGASVHVASLSGIPVAVGLTLADGKRQQIPFAASLRQYRDHAPNMFLYWRMLDDAISRGCTGFDFGRSTRGSGTHRFKQQWGSRERALPWYYQLAPGASVPEVKVDNPRYQLAIRAWKHLPVPIASWLGQRLTRHLP